MAQETNQTPGPMLCNTGCGFYGNPRTNGMCSVCYKEHLQRQNSGRISPMVKVHPYCFHRNRAVKKQTDAANQMRLIISKCDHLFMKAEVLAVCWSGAFRHVLTQHQGGNTSAMILEKQMLVHIKFGRIIKTFPNNLKSVLQ